jgi:hypothetical protein
MHWRWLSDHTLVAASSQAKEPRAGCNRACACAGSPLSLEHNVPYPPNHSAAQASAESINRGIDFILHPESAACSQYSCQFNGSGESVTVFTSGSNRFAWLRCCRPVRCSYSARSAHVSRTILSNSPCCVSVRNVNSSAPVASTSRSERRVCGCLKQSNSQANESREKSKPRILPDMIRSDGEL